MLIVMKTDASEKELDDVLERITQSGFSGHVSKGVERTVIGIVGQIYPELHEIFEVLPGEPERWYNGHDPSRFQIVRRCLCNVSDPHMNQRRSMWSAARQSHRIANQTRPR